MSAMPFLFHEYIVHKFFTFLHHELEAGVQWFASSHQKDIAYVDFYFSSSVVNRDEPILLFSTYFSFQQFFYFLPILLNILLEIFLFC